MNKFLLASAACTLIAVPAFAQAPVPGVVPVPTAQAPGPGMMMAERVQTRAEAVERVQRGFAMLDVNHDNVIDRNELASISQRWGMRRDQDGVAQPGGMAGRGAGGAGMGRLLAMADTNGDGQVTLAEATAGALQRFDQLDTNHDGQLTPDERAAGRAQRGQTGGH